MAKPTETVLAYCAGLIDGEGCITVIKLRRKLKDGTVLHDYQLALIVVTKDSVLTKWLYGNFGGRVGMQTGPRVDGERKTYKKWSVHSQRALRVLKAIRPYLVLKREQCELAIQFQNCANRNLWKHKPVGGDVRREYEKFYLELRAAKRAAVETEFPRPFTVRVCDSPTSEQSEQVANFS